MLLPKPIAEGVRDGRITLAFRRWEAPRVKIGSTQLTAAGIVGFDAVDEIVDLATLSDTDALAAGLPDAETLRKRLAPGAPARSGPRSSKGGDRVYRVRMRYLGEDPRLTLREQVPDGADLAELTAAVAKLDAGKKTGPWTRPILEWIAANPGVVSKELAALLDRDLLPMKADIRKLKALGLTISLEVGYRLSPRGAAYLASLG
ncbi:hypothetical protein [Nakamurella lactea]|uniref:hypothetical protein n=1 Tax=Nakamurella lactea TaxID=459515 RepID=UPI0003FB3C20|nr:hypothetical protein [Nakamurella lactea]